MTTRPHCLGPVVRQHVMVCAPGGAKLLTHSSQKAEREEGAGSQCPLQVHTPVSQRPAIRVQLHKVPPPPTEPQAGDHVSDTPPREDIWNHQTVALQFAALFLDEVS